MAWGGRATTATAERPPIGQGGGQQRVDRCRGENRRCDDKQDYVNRRVGLDEAPLDDGQRKSVGATY